MRDLFFLHIPKTGGLSVKAMIDAEGYNIVGVNNFDAYRPADSPVAYLGHITGLFMEDLPPRIFKFTFLRHPAERLRSLYNYIHSLAGEGYQHYLRIGFRPEHSFSEFVQVRSFANLRSGMTRQLGGAKFLFDTDSPSTATAYYLAARNRLERMDYIGTLETFSEDIEAIASLAGWSLPHIIRTNYAQAPKLESLSDDEIELVQKCNTYDMMLYRDAVKLRQQRKLVAK